MPPEPLTYVIAIGDSAQIRFTFPDKPASLPVVDALKRLVALLDAGHVGLRVSMVAAK